ncbi:urea active transporter-like protein 1 [Elsinoe australis]|uniref:Urea active transporter-like protein 1 n=1 Tax=Elsinoe australis TaxID=40998 RepID=A0A4U7AXY0_9PEZI|nr:urea active transporter-like protein 1 [Elsinoe australis]
MAGGIGQGSGRPPPLSQAVGYGVIVGLGFLFAFGMMLTTYVLRRYNNELQTSEVFSTAGRTVKTGLVASAVVSSWTWAATLLQSSSVAYRYGVSGPFWYASGATVQIILFATIAIELKRRAPNAHTFLEVIRARYGPVTHGVFMVFALMTNILVTAMLLAGGSAVTTTLTGMPIAAACFLLPVGVVLYTVFGGIKATFLTDYVHTVVVLIILFIFSFATYATNSVLGSPGRVWDALKAASERHPVEGNAEGSYLTMRSREGGIFFVINIIGNFGTVFMDNGYYNKAIAAGISNALPGYVMGGLSWFAIPWLAATAMGLAALSLENNPVWSTYPDRMAPADVTAGLVLPEAAVALLGSGGAAAVLLIVFMAVTSAMSAQLIAVSSIATYDVYQTYINPTASGKRLIWVSHMSCIAFATIMAGVSTGLYYAGISLGYLYLLMGVIISGAVIPASLTLLWSRQSWAAATFSPPLALACSLTGWLVQASREGPLTVDVTGGNNPMLVGNVVALLAPALFVPVFSLVFKNKPYDWVSMAEIRKADDADMAAAAHVDLEQVPGEHSRSSEEARAEMAKLDKSAKIARMLCAGLTLAFLILWPMPMYGSGYVFSRKFFTGWIVVGLVWLFMSFFCVGVYPLWEGRATMVRTGRAIWRDVTGQGRVLKGREVVVEQTEEVKGKDGEGDKSSDEGEKMR